jgi:acyl dehydratase
MAANTAAIGRTFAPHIYLVGREKVREYALAVGETNPLYLKLEAARAAGHADVVAPPMFAAVYAGPAFHEALVDPELGIDFEMLVHAGQEFEWGPLVIAGDEITTQVELADVSEKLGMSFYAFASHSRNDRDQEVCRGTWTILVRPRL